MGGGPRVTHLTDPEARDVFLDDTDLCITASTVQEGFEQFCELVSISASPGFTWGKSGTVPKGTYLLNDTVPSYKTGRYIFLYEPILKYIYVSNYISTTYSIDLIQHNKVTYSVVQTVTVTSDYAGDFYFTGVSVNRGWELAIRVSPSSANKPSEITAGALMQGKMILT